MSTSSADPYPLFTVFSFIGFFLVLVPLPWHLQSWNSGTCLYMLWTALACINQFVNSIVWRDNAINWAPVWCDISSRIIVGTAVALPAASLCINRRLYKIATMQSVNIARSEKRRAVFEDLAIGLGIPIVEMALYYIVQGHRFDIYEQIGCYPVVVNVWLNYLLVASWPIVIGIVSGIYCILSLRSFYKRQMEFNQVLQSSSSLTLNRYFRLMALASTDLLCTIPLATYIMCLNLSVGLGTYRGWADLHFEFSRVDQFPSLLWTQDHTFVLSVELNRWLTVACALVFFSFFGFAEEARRNYRLGFWKIMGLFGRKQKAQTWNIPLQNLGNSRQQSHNVLDLPSRRPRRNSMDSIFDPTESSGDSTPSDHSHKFRELPESIV